MVGVVRFPLSRPRGWGGQTWEKREKDTCNGKKLKGKGGCEYALGETFPLNRLKGGGRKKRKKVPTKEKMRLLRKVRKKTQK